MASAIDNSASSRDGVAQLISELEESKFRLLFRYMADLPYDREVAGTPAMPDLVGDQEFLIRTVGEYGSFGSHAASWAFQLAYVPVGLWGGATMVDELKKRLEAVHRAVSANPKLGAILRGEGPTSRRHDVVHPLDEHYHYLATNIAEPLVEEQIDDLFAHYRSLFGRRYGIEDKHDQFGMWTPLSILRERRREVLDFVLQLMNAPSSYDFIAYEGRIVVQAEREHGWHLVRDGTRVHPATVTRRLAVDVLGLGDLEEMLNRPRTSEAEIQDFLEKHPHFLQGLDGCACEIRSHVNLVASNGSRQVPDFMLRLEESDRWNILELKKPDASLFLGNRPADGLAHTAAKAIAQLLRYRDAAHTASSRRAMLEQYGSFPFEPSLTVLIGRGASDRRFRWHPPAGGLPGVDLVTYDYLLERARDSAQLVEDLRAETDVRRDAVGSNRLAGL